MAENPFKVMGLDPSVLRGLTDFRIQALVQTVYRALARVYHPDVAGSDRKIRELNEAKEELDDPIRFAYWKKQYLKKRKDRMEEHERIIAEKEEEKKKLEARMFEFWQEAVHPVGLSLFNVREARILLTDQMDSAIRDKEDLFKGSSLRGWELVVSKNGQIQEYATERVRFRPDKQDPPDLPEGWVYATKTPGGFGSYYIKRKGSGRVLTGIRLLGTIDRDHIGFDYRELRTFTALLERGEYAGVDPLHGFPWDTFRVYSAYITPRIEKGRTLVGIRKEEKDFRFSVLGSIRAIWTP